MWQKRRSPQLRTISSGTVRKWKYECLIGLLPANLENGPLIQIVLVAEIDSRV